MKGGIKRERGGIRADTEASQTDGGSVCAAHFQVNASLNDLELKPVIF